MKFAQQQQNKCFLTISSEIIRLFINFLENLLNMNSSFHFMDVKEEPLLKVENLCIYKDGKIILDNLNFKVYPGEIFGFLGPNGAGKSSLAYSIMGLKGYGHTSGKIYYKGKDISKLSVWERSRLGICLSWQEPVRFEGLTVRDYLKISSRDGNPDDYEKYLKMFGLGSAEYLDRIMDDGLSGGERKRIELAAVFASNSELILLDEPDSGIDIQGVIKIKEILKNTGKCDRSLVLITHQEEIAAISNKIAFICKGSIEKTGETKHVLGYFKGRCLECSNQHFV